MRTLLMLIIALASAAPALAEDGMLIFKTEPRDVKVYVDGAFKGQADQVLTLDVSEGNHKVKIAKDGKSMEKDYFVPAGGLVKVELALDGSERKGKLSFNFVRIEPGTLSDGFQQRLQR